MNVHTGIREDFINAIYEYLQVYTPENKEHWCFYNKILQNHREVIDQLKTSEKV